MTPAQLRATLAFLGLDTAEAAHLLGVTERAVRMWLQPAGSVSARAIPPPVERLLWLLVRDKRAGRGVVRAALRVFEPEWEGE